jgi:hypothetical protein
MKQVFFYLSGVILLLMLGCKGNNQPATGSESEITTGTDDMKGMSEGHRYGIKSGMVVYNAPMGMIQTLYFDDFGKKEVTITEMDMGGTKFKTTDIRKDGYNYNFKEGEKTGKKSVWTVQNQNYDKLDPEIVKQFKLKDLGNERIAGKECKKFSMEIGSTPSNAWIWNGVLIKSVTSMMGKEFIIEATKVEEGPVPAEVFELPADVTFTL